MNPLHHNNLGYTFETNVQHHGFALRTVPYVEVTFCTFFVHIYSMEWIHNIDNVGIDYAVDRFKSASPIEPAATKFRILLSL
jgi:hypothetical protein